MVEINCAFYINMIKHKVAHIYKSQLNTIWINFPSEQIYTCWYICKYRSIFCQWIAYIYHYNTVRIITHLFHYDSHTGGGFVDKNHKIQQYGQTSFKQLVKTSFRRYVLSTGYCLTDVNTALNCESSNGKTTCLYNSTVTYTHLEVSVTYEAITVQEINAITS